MTAIAFEVYADVSKHLISYDAQKNAKTNAVDPCSVFPLDGSQCFDLCWETEPCRALLINDYLSKTLHTSQQSAPQPQYVRLIYFLLPAYLFKRLLVYAQPFPSQRLQFSLNQQSVLSLSKAQCLQLYCCYYQHIVQLKLAAFAVKRSTDRPAVPLLCTFSETKKLCKNGHKYII